MSLYGYMTRRDLSQFGSFLLMGLIGIVLASLVNIFVASSALQFAISVIGVPVFTRLTARDTQRIKAIYLASDPGGVLAKKALMGALALYLDFIYLFVLLLRQFRLPMRMSTAGQSFAFVARPISGGSERR